MEIIQKGCCINIKATMVHDEIAFEVFRCLLVECEGFQFRIGRKKVNCRLFGKHFATYLILCMANAKLCGTVWFDFEAFKYS